MDATVYKLADHYVVNHLFPLLRERFLQDYRTHQHLSATWTTAHYIAKKMPFVKALPRREDVLDVAMALGDRPGLYLEFGVFEGDSLNHIASKTQRIVHGFDSFEGLPEGWNADNPKGKFSKDIGWRPHVRPNVELHVGWFDKSLPEFLSSHPGSVSFLHIDCDLYASTKIVFDCLADRIVRGTVIVFDEYFSYPGWEQNEFAAFQEFVKRRNLEYRYVAYHRNGQEVALQIG